MYEPGEKARTTTRGWTCVYWALIAAFLLTVVLNLLHVDAGFLTSYLADLTLPALLYVISRGLAPGKRRILLMQWLGRTPERAAAVFFLSSTATEISQIFWPQGFFAGRYDPWDIVAYGVGIVVCYHLDSRPETRPAGDRTRLAAARHTAERPTVGRTQYKE